MLSLKIGIEILEDVMKANNLSAVQKLNAYISRYLTKVLEELLAPVLLLEEEALSPPHLKKVIERRDYAERLVRELAKECIQQGGFPDGDPKMITFAIFGAMNWIPKWYKPSGEKSPPEIAKEFANYLLKPFR